MSDSGCAISFWDTVKLLLAAARKRAEGRRKRQQELLQIRSPENATDWGSLGFAFTVLFAAMVNVLAAAAVGIVVALHLNPGQRPTASKGFSCL
jgi:hypothetical protein